MQALGDTYPVQSRSERQNHRSIRTTLRLPQSPGGRNWLGLISYLLVYEKTYIEQTFLYYALRAAPGRSGSSRLSTQRWIWRRTSSTVSSPSLSRRPGQPTSAAYSLIVLAVTARPRTIGSSGVGGAGRPRRPKEDDQCDQPSEPKGS